MDRLYYGTGRESESRQFLDKFVSDYDEHQLNDNYKKLIGRIVGDVGKTEKVLDSACGTGIVALALSKNVSHIEALDCYRFSTLHHDTLEISY